MSWNDFYRRRAAMNAVLAQVERDPDGPLPFEDIPQVTEEFANREELLLAMQHRWMQLLTGKVAIALDEAEHDPLADGVEAVAAGWRELAAQEPVLRRLLDRHGAQAGDALREAIDREQRMLALASGLSEPFEEIDEVTRTGAAYASLIHSTPQRSTARRENSFERLLGRLIPSA
jgi:AcrR family transcriptional regulator